MLNLFLRQGDVCDSWLVNHIFNTEIIDVIFHLAALTHVGEQRWLYKTVSMYSHRDSLLRSPFLHQSRLSKHRLVSSG